MPDGDGDALRGRLDEAVALLHHALGDGTRVYLHCNAGQNRAPTVAIAYLHVHHGYELDAARDLVKSRRPCVPYMRVLTAHYDPARRRGCHRLRARSARAPAGRRSARGCGRSRRARARCSTSISAPEHRGQPLDDVQPEADAAGRALAVGGLPEHLEDLRTGARP